MGKKKNLPTNDSRKAGSNTNLQRDKVLADDGSMADRTLFRVEFKKPVIVVASIAKQSRSSGSTPDKKHLT